MKLITFREPFMQSGEITLRKVRHVSRNLIAENENEQSYTQDQSTQGEETEVENEIKTQRLRKLGVFHLFPFIIHSKIVSKGAKTNLSNPNIATNAPTSRKGPNGMGNRLVFLKIMMEAN